MANALAAKTGCCSLCLYYVFLLGYYVYLHRACIICNCVKTGKSNHDNDLGGATTCWSRRLQYNT